MVWFKLNFFLSLCNVMSYANSVEPDQIMSALFANVALILL